MHAINRHVLSSARGLWYRSSHGTVARTYQWKRCSSSSKVAPLSHPPEQYKVGDILSGYTVSRIQEVPELSLTGYLLNHDASGAEHLHVARDDPNNVFSVTLKTTPQDSSGVAHILEHLALCGSVKYPCRDPFMKMVNRSMATFMNALTWPDMTMYPFSTQNPKDFENLLKVYLDAVFFPRLRYIDFRQEGWRLEHEDINDRTSPIVLRGVVFNEMKGVFSSSSAIYSRFLMNKIFPSNIYSHESGGDPLEIPKLTHDYLKGFHSKHYHPSNARFYTYGNLPLETHLSLINDFILSKFKRDDSCRALSKVEDQPKWDQPQAATINCPPDPFAPFPEKQTAASLSFLMEQITNNSECFVLSMLTHLLTVGPNSPFYKSLLASGLGMDYSPGHGLNEFTKQSTFSIGLQGIAEKDVEKVHEIIMATLTQVAEEGFPPERVEAVLHMIELSLKHQSQSFGLHLIMNLNPIWNHEGDVIDALRVNKTIQEFRERLAQEPNFLGKKVAEHFLQNSHRLFLVMNPSEDYIKIYKEKEHNLLEEKKRKLTEADKEDIFNEALELEKVQKADEDVSILPTLAVDKDISRETTVTHFDNLIIGEVPVQVSDQQTNGINYFKALFRINEQEIPEDLKPYLPIFCEVVTKVGAGARNHMEMDQEILLRTRGLNASVHIAENPVDWNEFEQGVVFSSFCLEKNLDNMLNLWSDIFNDAKFEADHSYLSQLVKITAAEVSDSIVQGGHRFAMRRAASSLCNASLLRESVTGLTFASVLKKQAESEDVQELIVNLKRIAKIVFKKDNLRCALNAEASAIRNSLTSLDTFMDTLPKRAAPDVSNIATSPLVAGCLQEHHVLPFATNYIGKAQTCVPYTHPDFAALKIASRLLSAKYLHREIREKGGAYGGGASLSQGGIFNYYSYRDPNVTRTLDTFVDSIKWLSEGKFKKEDIDEAKLSTFQEVDKPVNPGEKGVLNFQFGITDEMRHQYRMRLLEVRGEDLVRVSKTYLTKSEHFGVAVLGPENEETKSQKWQRVLESN